VTSEDDDMADIEVSRDEGTATVAPRGDLVASVVPRLREQMKALLAEGAAEIVCDLSGVEIVDSSGIGLLVATHNSLARAGGKLLVTGASEDVLGLFRSMRLDRHFAVAGR
jgi:anti-anti-sigma factor